MCSQWLQIVIFMLSVTKGFSLSTQGFARAPLRSNALFASATSNLSNLSTPPIFNFLPNITVTGDAGWSVKGEVLVVPFYKAPKAVKGDKEIAQALIANIPSSLPAELHQLVASVLEDGLFKGEAASKQVVRVAGGSLSVKHVALVGLGTAETRPSPANGNANSKADLEVKVASKLGKAIAAVAKSTKAQSLTVAAPPALRSGGLSQVLLALYDALYVDARFKKPVQDAKPKVRLETVHLIGCDGRLADEAPLAHELTKKIADGVEWAKDLVGAPSNYKTPVFIAEQAKKMAGELGLECTVLGEEECKALGMGGYLGVQQGSRFPPQFVHLVYRPSGSGEVTKVALVGKGLTFDSGGYNLKAGAGSMIELMKFDMGGCAAVLGAAKAIAQLKPSGVEVHFISAICENMISSEAMRPGDVLTTMSGKTIEVLNTDAEGRLTLADALVYAERQQVDYIVDLATLTGACIMGLGEKVAALYSPDAALQKAIQEAAARSDEAVWHMPLEERYRESVKSKLADLKNVAGIKGGGSITAALFLQEFVEHTPWAHIDMAGPVWDTAAGKPTGFGVKLLVDLLLTIPKPTKPRPAAQL